MESRVLSAATLALGSIADDVMWRTACLILTGKVTDVSDWVSGADDSNKNTQYNLFFDTPIHLTLL